MDSASIYIGLGILAIIILPFYISYLKRKAKTGNDINQFIESGFKYGIEITETDLWKNRIIGLDSIKRKVLFRQNNTDDFVETLIDLNDVSSCVVETKFSAHAGNERVIEKIDLLFRTKQGKSTISIPVYDSEADMIIYTELEIAEKWATLCSSLIK